MKTYISYLVIALLMAHTLTAQVKIGDNPQTLNPSSILELESTSSVLVITRVTDVQMNAITPLRGALVYNTDQNCLHYYNGDEWINICESLDNSFTVSTLAEHMRPINPNALDDTVVITETPNPDGSINYNFEVGILNGANIAPSAINGDKIQNGTVGSQDLAPRSVGLSHLQDGGANGDLFQWNGSAWTLINQADISITEVDGIIGNEVVDATDGTLTRTGNGIDIPYTLGVSPLGIGTNELADDSVTNEKINANVAGNGLNQAADGSLEVVVSDLVGDGSLSSPASTIALTGTPSGSLLENVGIDVADNAITSAKIFDGTIATIDIADNAINSAKIVDGTIVAADLTDGAVTSAKILDATIATIDIADNAINSSKIVDGTIVAADLADASVTLPKIADGTTTGQLMQWNGTDWILVEESSLNITEVDGIIGNEVTGATDATLELNGTGVVGDPYTLDVATGGIGTNEIADASVTLPKIADGTTAGQLMQWNGTDWILVEESSLNITEVDGIIGNEVTGATDATLELNGTGVVGDPYTLDVATGGIGTNEIADASVTLPKIADGTTAGQLMQWDGTDWILVEESSLNITEVDGIIGNEVTGATDATLELNGTGVVGDPYTLDVATGGIGTNEIADASVTLPKIADGTTAGQLMQWDGTDWILVEESSLNITEDDGIVGNEVVDATVGGSLVRLGGGTDIDPYTLDVNDGGIGTLELANAAVTTDKIADADVTPAKIEPSSSLTDGQVLTTIGGNTVWRSPYHAIGKVINSTPTANILGANIIPLNTGNYRVVFSTNANSADYIIQLSVLNAAASGYVIEVVTQDVDNFTVQITNLSGAAVDATWFFTVTDF